MSENSGSSSITLIGPGAIGCTLLGQLASSQIHQLQIVGRTPFETLRVDTESSTIETSVPFLTDRGAVAEFSDWVLVCVKTYDFAAILPWLEKLAGPDARIAIIQNGIEHLDRLPAEAPWKHLVPVMIDCPVERIGPGHVYQRGPILMRVPESAEGRSFCDLFDQPGVTAETCADWKTIAWRKLCLNAVGAINAVIDRPPGIFRSHSLRALAREVALEVVSVGRAEDAEIDESLVDEVLQKVETAPPDAINSLHADRIAGRPMEIEARNGVIVRLGEKHGIPTPRNATLVALLEALQMSSQPTR